jgi:hypothetical protein
MKGKSLEDRNIDNIVFCPTDIPGHTIDVFKSKKSDFECKRYGAFNNDAGKACI